MKVITAEELKKDMLKNKHKYIGKLLMDKQNNIYVVVDVNEKGIVCYQIEKMPKGYGA